MEVAEPSLNFIEGGMRDVSKDRSVDMMGELVKKFAGGGNGQRFSVNKRNIAVAELVVPQPWEGAVELYSELEPLHCAQHHS